MTMTMTFQNLNMLCPLVLTSVSNGTFQDKGTEVPSLSGDKGTTRQRDKLKIILPRDGMGQDNLSKTGTGRYVILIAVPSRPAGQNGTQQKRTV